MRLSLLSAILVVVLIVLSSTIVSDAQEQIWCVASPKATDAMLWPVLQWVCANGADCSQLQEDQPCYDPDTVFDHASYAINNYWQRSKKLGGLCNFNNLAIPTNVDPSHGSCRYEVIP